MPNVLMPDGTSLYYAPGDGAGYLRATQQRQEAYNAQAQALAGTREGGDTRLLNLTDPAETGHRYEFGEAATPPRSAPASAGEARPSTEALAAAAAPAAASAPASASGGPAGVSAPSATPTPAPTSAPVAGTGAAGVPAASTKPSTQALQSLGAPPAAKEGWAPGMGDEVDASRQRALPASSTALSMLAARRGGRLY